MPLAVPSVLHRARPVPASCVLVVRVELEPIANQLVSVSLVVRLGPHHLATIHHPHQVDDPDAGRLLPLPDLDPPGDPIAQAERFRQPAGLLRAQDRGRRRHHVHATEHTVCGQYRWRGQRQYERETFGRGRQGSQDGRSRSTPIPLQARTPKVGARPVPL